MFIIDKNLADLFQSLSEIEGIKSGKMVYALNLCLQQYAEPKTINSESDLLQFLDDVEEFNKSVEE